MQKAAGILYTVGKVFNIIGIVVMGILILGSVAMLADSQQYFNQYAADLQVATLEEFTTLITGMLIGCIIALAIQIITLVFANKGKKALGNGEVKPQIIVLVFAILGESIFYLIASILGLVLASSNKKPTVDETTDSNNNNVQ